MQKQAHPPLMLCLQSVSRELKFPQGGAVQMHTLMDGFAHVAVGLGAESSGG